MEEDAMAREEQAPNDIPDDLAAPGCRALAAAGYTSLDHLARSSEADLLELHGMGRNAIVKLRSALHASGRSFAEDER
jgi:hypothetical protein